MTPTTEKPSRLVREAVGVFQDARALEAAVDSLMSHGFDRAEISLLAGERVVEAKLGAHYRRVQDLEDDPAAPRRAFVSTEAVGDAQGALIGGLIYLGGAATAGALVATGGSLVGAAIAAALGGSAGGLVGSALAGVVGDRHARGLQEQLDHGGLLLWVRTRDAEHEEKALSVLEDAGASDVHIHGLLDQT